jgi:hypothetical protein
VTAPREASSAIANYLSRRRVRSTITTTATAMISRISRVMDMTAGAYS